MYAVKEMHKMPGSEQIIYLSQHTRSGARSNCSSDLKSEEACERWKWDVVDSVTACGFTSTRSLAFNEALVAAGWIDVEYWRRLAG